MWPSVLVVPTASWAALLVPQVGLQCPGKKTFVACLTHLATLLIIPIHTKQLFPDRHGNNMEWVTATQLQNTLVKSKMKISIHINSQRCFEGPLWHDRTSTFSTSVGVERVPTSRKDACNRARAERAACTLEARQLQGLDLKHKVSCISYHIISYHIISYNII